MRDSGKDRISKVNNVYDRGKIIGEREKWRERERERGAREKERDIDNETDQYNKGNDSCENERETGKVRNI